MAKYPKIKSITLTPINPPNTVNYYVQHISEVRVQVSVDYGPDKNPNSKCYVCYKGGQGRQEGTDVTLPIYDFGTLEIEVSAENSWQGDKAVETRTIEAVRYQAPSIHYFDLERCDYYGTPDPNGTYMKASVGGFVDKLNYDNTKLLKIRYKKVTTSAKYQAVNVAIDWNFEASTVISGIAKDQPYEFIAELTDMFNTDTRSSQNGKVLMSRLAGGNGVKFFGEATTPGFWVGDVQYDWSGDPNWTFGRNDIEGILIDLKTNNDGEHESFTANIKNATTKATNAETKATNLENLLTTKYVTVTGLGELLVIPIFKIAIARFYAGQRIMNAGDTDYLGSGIPPEYYPANATALAVSCVNMCSARITKQGEVQLHAHANVNNADVYISGVYRYS